MKGCVGIQITQCSQDLQTLGTNVGIICILGSLGLNLETDVKVLLKSLTSRPDTAAYRVDTPRVSISFSICFCI